MRWHHRPGMVPTLMLHQSCPLLLMVLLPQIKPMPLQAACACSPACCEVRDVLICLQPALKLQRAGVVPYSFHVSMASRWIVR